MATTKRDDEMQMRNSGDLNALLGRGSEFEGKLTFEGTVRIDGKFSGEIVTNDVLVIGEGARVQAEISAGSVVINGEVQGNIRAKSSIELRQPVALALFQGGTLSLSEPGRILPELRRLRERGGLLPASTRVQAGEIRRQDRVGPPVGDDAMEREHEEVIEAVQARLDKNPDAMRRRRETVEHPFGTIKMRMGATHFLCKTLPKVATEMALCVLTYNLTRVINIVGVAKLMEAITA